MNDDPVEIRLRELAWRGELSDAERSELRAWLVAHPEAQTNWEIEEHLSALLNQLPDAPVSSNFTARVMHAVEREATASRLRPVARWDWLLRPILPRVAVAALVVAVGLVGYHRYEVAQRNKFAESLVAVSEVQSLPSTEFLENFDAISRIGRTPHVDEELLALMQ